MLPLLALELDRRGVPASMIGLQTAVQAGASICTALILPRLIVMLGPRVLLAGAILTAAAVVLSFPLMPSTVLWFPLRFLLGGCLTVLFIVSEYWITGVAEENRRGIVTGIYATFLSLGFAAGPAILSAIGSVGWLPYATGAAIFVLGLFPVLVGGGAVPHHEDGAPETPVTEVLMAAPVAVLAAFFFGAIESSGFSFLPIWGEHAGLNETQAALLLTMSGLGNVALQIPIGLLSDRINRRQLILGCALFGAAGVLCAPSLVATPSFLFAGVFLWSGIVGGIYTVGLAHLGERFRGSRLASANAAFILNYSLGMLVGPPAAGMAIEWLDPHGFVLALAAMSAGYALIIIARLLQQARTA